MKKNKLKKKQMKLKGKVVFTLIVLYLFMVSTQIYVTYTITGMAGASQFNQQGSVGVTVIVPCQPPQYLDGTTNVDNYSANLNWSYVWSANSYNLYYSSNISAIMTLNLSNIPSDVSNFSNITNLNYTDTTAYQVQKR